MSNDQTQYPHPQSSTHSSNRLLFDKRHDKALRQRIITNLTGGADQYHLDATAQQAVQALIDSRGLKVSSDCVQPLVDVGAHALHALLTLHVINSHWNRIPISHKRSCS